MYVSGVYTVLIHILSYEQDIFAFKSKMFVM